MANENKVRHQGWVASLSNGETVFQEPNLPGERTAWGKLVDRCAASNKELWVTQIQMQMYGRTVVGIKSAAGYTTFVDYRAEGFMGGERPGREVRYFGIGSVIGDKVYCTLLNEEGQTWQDSRQLASMRLHCILKPTS